MLVRLTIKNFALIKDAEVSFEAGLTAVTGETGAGKSLLVGAVTFLAGGKVSPGVVRDNSRMAVVEGDFRIPNRPVVTIRRELYSDNRVRSYYDDRPISNRELSLRMAELIDITSQRAFSRLLDKSHHLQFLDQFAGLIALREEISLAASGYATLQRKINKLERAIAEQTSQREMAEFQLKEIESVNPEPGEDDTIRSELKRLENVEEIHQEGAAAVGLISTETNSAIERLSDALRLVQRISSHDNALLEMAQEIDNYRTGLKEIARVIEERCLSLDYSPRRLETLRDRLSKLSGLARKFGGSLSAVLERKEKLLIDLQSVDCIKQELAGLIEERERILDRWRKLAEEAGDRRRIAAKRLENSVLNSLNLLGIEKARFEVRVTRSADPEGLFVSDDSRWRLDDNGADVVEFYMSANPGIEPRPVIDVASGGELSRLLLALKEALPQTGDDVTVLFDEIDTGISGRIARLVGEKLREISKGRQLIAITHLPQIAALANRHLKVIKESNEGEMQTGIHELNNPERISEIASLLSDGRITDAALQQARTLIG